MIRRALQPEREIIEEWFSKRETKPQKILLNYVHMGGCKRFTIIDDRGNLICLTVKPWGEICLEYCEY
jgi:hypothetical protein